MELANSQCITKIGSFWLQKAERRLGSVEPAESAAGAQADRAGDDPE